MSHFSVAVFVPEPEYVDRALAPYSQDDRDYYEKVEYMTKEDYIRMYRNNHGDTQLTDEEIWTIHAPQDYEIVDLGEGMIYEWYNPNAMWDWYEIGGRWRQSLCIPKGAENVGGLSPRKQCEQRGKCRWVNGARIKDVDWVKVNKASCARVKELSKKWEELMSLPEESWTRKRTLSRYGTKEEYIMLSSLYAPYAFINPDDDCWYDEDSTPFKEYIHDFYEIIHNPYYKDWWIVIVDCHM